MNWDFTSIIWNKRRGRQKLNASGLKMCLFVAAALLAVLLGQWSLTPRAAKAKVYIDIDAPSLRRFPIAIQDFKNLGPPTSNPAVADLGEQIGEILRYDMELSGLFYVLDPLIYLENADAAGIKIGQFDFNDWRLIGAEALIKGGYEIEGDKLTLEARLFDVFLNKLIVGVRYNGRVSDIRLMSHKWIDKVIKKLTGQQGIFQTKIAFVSPGKDANDIYIMDADGYNPVKILANGALNLFPSWTPAGDGLLFTSYVSGDPEIYLRRLRVKEMTRLTNWLGLDYGAQWSPVDNMIAYSGSLQGNSEIYLMTKDNPQKRIPITRNWGIDIMPSWSPDGKWLAFVSDRCGSPQIYIIKRDGTGVRRLTYSGAYNTSPAWSPKGDRIAFVGKEKNNVQNIYLINADGSQLRSLTSGPGNEERPSWSPDGRTLAFSSTKDAITGIYILHVDGKMAPIRISPSDLPATQPCWSPYQGDE